jgi:hypothetical protein
MECFEILRFTRYIQPFFYALKNPNGKSGFNQFPLQVTLNDWALIEKTRQF